LIEFANKRPDTDSQKVKNSTTQELTVLFLDPFYPVASEYLDGNPRKKKREGVANGCFRSKADIRKANFKMNL
jgi:hypothetical protein